ncbi:hypothetical protein NFJ02_23g52210 [Pycnococcus provasolii]
MMISMSSSSWSSSWSSSSPLASSARSASRMIERSVTTSTGPVTGAPQRLLCPLLLLIVVCSMHSSVVLLVNCLPYSFIEQARKVHDPQVKFSEFMQARNSLDHDASKMRIDNNADDDAHVTGDSSSSSSSSKPQQLHQQQPSWWDLNDRLDDDNRLDAPIPLLSGMLPIDDEDASDYIFNPPFGGTFWIAVGGFRVGAGWVARSSCGLSQCPGIATVEDPMAPHRLDGCSHRFAPPGVYERILREFKKGGRENDFAIRMCVNSEWLVKTPAEWTDAIATWRRDMNPYRREL